MLPSLLHGDQIRFQHIVIRLQFDSTLHLIDGFTQHPDASQASSSSHDARYPAFQVRLALWRHQIQGCRTIFNLRHQYSFTGRIKAYKIWENLNIKCVRIYGSFPWHNGRQLDLNTDLAAYLIILGHECMRLTRPCGSLDGRAHRLYPCTIEDLFLQAGGLRKQILQVSMKNLIIEIFK